MTHPTGRVLALLELLQAHRELTGGQLAERLGVDVRTVRRYVGHLADLGVPVHATRGRYGGYRIAPGYRLPPLMLGEDEAVAVVLGLIAGERLGAAPGRPAGAAALTKIQRVLPAALAARVAAMAATLELTLPRRDATAPGTGTLLALADATHRQRRVAITYRSWRGEDSARELDPYGLVLHSGRWYMTGHDHRRGAVRSFRLDRIGAVRETGDGFDAPAGFDPVTEVSMALARVPYRHPVEVVLHTDLAAARRRIPPTVGQLSEVDDGVLLRCRAERLDGMAQMLAGLGFRCTVREPAALRDELRALAARLAADADRDG